MRAILIACLFISACYRDETVSAYGAADRVWVLGEIDGASFDQRATLSFPETNRIAGTAPCNSFSAGMSAPYPWFEVEQIAVTRMACAELEAEDAFLTALGNMTLSEVSGDTLILSNEQGREMVFTAAD